MSLLEAAAVPVSGPVFGVIAGDPGLGKSSLAALFPKPLFLEVEEGVRRVAEEIRPKSLRVKDFDHFRALLGSVLKDEHDYQTLVIDSMTALDRMFVDYVLTFDAKQPKSINQAAGGYGAGRQVVAGMHVNTLKGCRKIAEKRGMHVLFIAHTDTEKVDLPNKDPYMRYSFRMLKESITPYITDCDLVGFLHHEIYVRGEEEQRVKKAVGSGDRLFDCTSNVWSVAKNGYGIKEPLVFVENENPLVPFIPALQK